MQESWGAEILDNAKQFDTLFSLYSAPCKTQASSCQLLGVKPDATSLFHMETEIAPSGGAHVLPSFAALCDPGVATGMWQTLSPTAKKIIAMVQL